MPAKRENWSAVTVITVGPSPYALPDEREHTPSRISRPHCLAGTRSRAVTRPLACGLSVAVTVDDFQVSTVTGLSLAASSYPETRRSM